MKRFFIKTLKVKKWAVNLCIALILGCIGTACVLTGNFVVPSSAVSGVYYNGDKNSQNVTLMVNVYWGTEYLDSMLETFQENDVKTTFFIGGTWAVMNEDYLKKFDEQGHEIANHGYHHKDHDKLDEAGNLNEIKTTHTIVKNLLGKDMNLFAPPSGAYDKLTVSCADSLGYKTIMWTRDTIDWRDHNENLIYSRAVKDVKGGDLILMHPTEATAKALPKIIKTIKDKGLNLTTVSQTIGL